MLPVYNTSTAVETEKLVSVSNRNSEMRSLICATRASPGWSGLRRFGACGRAWSPLPDSPVRIVCQTRCESVDGAGICSHAATSWQDLIFVLKKVDPAELRPSDISFSCCRYIGDV